MKNSSFLICLVLLTKMIFSQGILPGDSLSPGIVYVDIPDVWLSASFPEGTDAMFLDIDEDGADDIEILSYKLSTMASTLQNTKCLAVFNSTAEIVVTEDNDYWVEQCPEGTPIGPESLWDSGGLLKEELTINSTTTYSGVFSNGYIGFRMMIEGQVSYGWIKAMASAGSVAVESYAYQDVSTGVKETEDRKITIYPNPVGQIMFVGGLTDKNLSYTYSIIDLTGKELKSGILTTSTEAVDCTRLPAGMYCVRIFYNGDALITRKFAKQ